MRKIYGISRISCGILRIFSGITDFLRIFADFLRNFTEFAEVGNYRKPWRKRKAKTSVYGVCGVCGLFTLQKTRRMRCIRCQSPGENKRKQAYTARAAHKFTLTRRTISEGAFSFHVFACARPRRVTGFGEAFAIQRWPKRVAMIPWTASSDGTASSRCCSLASPWPIKAQAYKKATMWSLSGIKFTCRYL